MIYTIANALTELYPNSSWALSGENYTDIDWRDNTIPMPNMDILLEWVKNKNMEEPMILLRKERNRRLDECRWIIEKYYTTDIPFPQEWKDYMQALRDLPSNANPKMDMLTGKLDMSSVNFPVLPTII